jgi:hypothetical protein
MDGLPAEHIVSMVSMVYTTIPAEGALGPVGDEYPPTVVAEATVAARLQDGIPRGIHTDGADL